MRNNVTFGLPLFICASIFTLMILFSVTGTVYAKRGCSAFGHSCFGGHGKRFDPHVRGNNRAVTSDRNQKTRTLHLNNDLGIVEQNFIGQLEVLLSQARPQDSSRFNPYTLSVVLQQWLKSHYRPHRPDLELSNQ